MHSPFSKKNIQKCLCGAENCRGVLGPKTGADASKLQRAASTASKLVKSAKRKLKQVIGDNEEEQGSKKKRRKTLPDAASFLAKARKQISKTVAPAVAPTPSKLDLKIQKQSRTDRAMKRSSSLNTLRSKAGRKITIRQSTSTYSLSSLQTSPKRQAQKKRHSMPLARSSPKGKSFASAPKSDIKSLAGSLMKKSSAAAGSVKRTYTKRKSLLGLPSSSKTISRTSSKLKLVGSNASLRQSKLSFGSGGWSYEEPEPSTPIEQGTPVRASKRTPKPSPKAVESGMPIKRKSSAKSKVSANTKPSPRARSSITPARSSNRTPKPSPKAKENEIFGNKPRAVARPGSSHLGKSASQSMAKSFKSAASKGVKGTKMAGSKIRLSLKGDEGVRKTVRKISGAA